MSLYLWHVLTTLRVYMNGKVSMVFNRNCFSRKWKTIQGYAPLKAVTYTVNAIMSKKWCRINTLLLHTSNRKYHMTYRFMTLGDLEGHLPVAGHQMQFNEHLCDISYFFNWHGASRGPSAIAELLVGKKLRLMTTNISLFIYTHNIVNTCHIRWWLRVKKV